MDRFANLLDGIQIRAARGILQLIETITQAGPIALYGPQMVSSGLILIMIRTTLETVEQLHIVAYYFSVMARIILADKTSFIQVLRASAYQFNETEDGMLKKLLDIWFDRVSVYIKYGSLFNMI
jgi:hypothetical protein